MRTAVILTAVAVVVAASLLAAERAAADGTCEEPETQWDCVVDCRTYDTCIACVDKVHASHDYCEPDKPRAVSVGGIQGLPDVAGAHLAASASRGSPIPVPAEEAAALAAGVVALGVGGWYARRRWRAG